LFGSWSEWWKSFGGFRAQKRSDGQGNDKGVIGVRWTFYYIVDKLN
jgi:hypothetical protein